MRQDEANRIRILRALRAAAWPMTPAHLSDSCGMPRRDVRKTLAVLVKQGDVSAVKEGSAYTTSDRLTV